ncbi:MAG: hypothetical protein QTN59_10320 [Candidatus Electrothrix communis]|nr:MAG: hypothetical protein QTN59_10320 [Candidatus Electrothrix communis]
MLKKFAALLLWSGTLFGCSPFYIDAQDNVLVHRESGLYVHRQVELRVNADRLVTPPPAAAPGAVSGLEASNFTPISVGSASFNPAERERHGDFLVWREMTHISKYAAKGKTSLGATVCWKKDGAVTVKDVFEKFPFPPPDISQLDTWSPWAEAGSRRDGTFAWHAEVNRHAAENTDQPHYPFQMRFKLVLSQRVYP